MVLTIGLSNGCTVVTGQRYGAGDMDGMRRSIGTCTVLSVLFTLLIMLVFHIIIDPALVLMNIPLELLEDAKAYVMIIVDGLFAMMGYNLLSGIMRSLGDSKTPLYFLIVSSVVNKCSCTAGACAVHPLLNGAAEECDLCIFSSQFYYNIRLRNYFLNGKRTCNNLLFEP